MTAMLDADALRWAYLAWQAYAARAALAHAWQLRAVPLVSVTLAALHLAPNAPSIDTWGHL